MSIDIIEMIPGGDPASRRRVWDGRDDLGIPQFVPDEVQSRRRQFVAQGISGLAAIKQEAMAQSAGPRVPDDIQSRRSGPLLNQPDDDELVPDEPYGISDRESAYVPLGNLGEDVMLLEDLGEAKPVIVHDHSKRRVEVNALADKRRQAICKAGVERDKAMDRVFRYDRAIAKYNANLKAAKDRGDQEDAKRWAARIVKLDSLRSIVSGNAVRFAKVQALGQAMLKSAVTESNLLTLSEMASKRGLPAEAQTLKAAANLANKNDQHYGELRKKQIANWSVQTAEANHKALKILAAQTDRSISQLTVKAVPAYLAGERVRQLEALRVKKIKIAGKLEQSRVQVRATTIKDVSQDTSVTKVEKKAALALALRGLESDLGGWWDDAKNAVGQAAGAVKSAVVDVAKAGVELAKKGACQIANNPKVISAAGAAITGAVSGGVGAAAGAGAGKAAALLKGACPKPAPLPPQSAILDPVLGWKPGVVKSGAPLGKGKSLFKLTKPSNSAAASAPVVTEEKKFPIVPVAAGTIGAGALLWLLL